MPIIKCPGCGGQLSTSAPACPRCQHVPTEEEISLATPHVDPLESQAVTQCSECGGQVSNRLNSCPHCGSPVEPQQSQINCPECEEDFGVSLAVCPHCGVANPKHQQVSPVAGGAILSGNVTQAARDKTFIQQGSSQSSGSGAFGIFLIFAGIVVAGYFAFGYDTTVGVTNVVTGEFMGRVHDFSLMDNRTIGVMIAVAVFVVGAIVALRSKSKK